MKQGSDVASAGPVGVLRPTGDRRTRGGTKVADAGGGLEVRKIRPAYQQVADQLRELIVTGELGPGSRLPNETGLSTMFGVSRSTVREALRTLSSQNLVTTSRGVGGGTFIVHPEPGDISDYLETSFALLSGSDDVTVDTLIELRTMLEVPAAGLAAERRSEADLEVLAETLELERDHLDDASGFEEHRAFHQTILEATGNPLLEVVGRPVFTTLRTRFLRDEAPRTFWERVLADHERIFQHIKDADTEGAQAAMRDHLDTLADDYARIDVRLREREAGEA